jgi:hypothetical protein
MATRTIPNAGDSQSGPSSVRWLRVLPGGAEAAPEAWYTAAILLAIILILVGGRRGFRGALAAAHVHIGGLDIFTAAAELIVLTIVLRTFRDWYAEKIGGPSAAAVTYAIP